MTAGQIVTTVFLTIVITVFSAIIHELSHALMCRLFKVKILGIKALFLFFDGQHVSCKFTGKSYCTFKTNDTRKMRGIVAAGPIVEIIIAFLCFALSLQIDRIEIKYGFLGGTILIAMTTIIDLIPCFNGDGKLLFTKGD